MRPRKKLLVFCPDEATAGILKYRMEVRHPINATVTGTKEALLEVLLGGQEWDAAVQVITPSLLNENVTIALLIQSFAGEATVRVEVWPKWERELYDHKWSTAHRKVWADDAREVCPVLMEAMRRKRGPKKPSMFVWPHQPVQEEACA